MRFTHDRYPAVYNHVIFADKYNSHTSARKIIDELRVKLFANQVDRVKSAWYHCKEIYELISIAESKTNNSKFELGDNSFLWEKTQTRRNNRCKLVVPLFSSSFLTPVLFLRGHPSDNAARMPTLPKARMLNETRYCVRDPTIKNNDILYSANFSCVHSSKYANSGGSKLYVGISSMRMNLHV